MRLSTSISLVLAASVAIGAIGCSRTPPPGSPAGTGAQDDQPWTVDKALYEVAAAHGAPGPWAVAGYRMAERALAKLRLPRGSSDLEVVHQSPREVQLACIADGAAAYSRASLGKLNLSLVTAADGAVFTTYTNKKSGQTIVLRPTAAFRARYLNAPVVRARELGREVMSLPEAEIFEEAAR